MEHPEIEEMYELSRFTSDDGKHQVEWVHYEPKGYDTWVCVTHDKAYYDTCILDDPKTN